MNLSTGAVAKKRLNREMKGKFGSEGYAFEKLIAELGSAFLMAELGIVGEVQHECYVASWLKALKTTNAIFSKLPVRHQMHIII